MLLFKSESFPNAALDAVPVRGAGGMLARNQDSKPRLAARSPREVKRVAGRRASLAFA